MYQWDRKIIVVWRRKLTRETCGLDWITPYLAVGPKPRLQSTAEAGPTWENLRASGITRVIDLRDSSVERRDAAKYRLKYNGAGVPDHPEPSELARVFPNVHDWIEEERKNGGRVYLHCQGGTGRSPTCAIAHLIASGKSRQESVRIVKEAHPPT